MKHRNLALLSLIVVTSFILAGCGKPTASSGKNVQFSSDTGDDLSVPTPTPYVDKLANEKITISEDHKMGQEFNIKFKTYNPDGQGVATFNAKSMKEITAAGKKTPGEGKKLILVEIGIKGSAKNKGDPSTFNQIGDLPSPQFVLIDKAANKSFTETTYFSDGYTVDKNLFELSKITLDNEQMVNTAIVFEVDSSYTPDLALRFTDIQGKTQFYEITK
jgi:hypothetical protein